MDYAGFITAVTAILEYDVGDASSDTPTSDVAFNDIIPSAINYTELRLQRDLDFIATSVTSIGTMTPNTRSLTLPSVDIPSSSQIPLLVGKPVPANSIITTTVGLQTFNVKWPEPHGLSIGQYVSFSNIIKVGGLTIGGVYNIIGVPDAENITLIMGYVATSSDSGIVIGNGIYVVLTSIQPIIGGRRQPPLEPVTRDFLDFAWPEEQSVGANIPPVQWCPDNQSSVLVGPAPDQAYGFVAVGTMRFPQLSSTNPSNFLSVQFPDLYVAAALVFLSGYQRDYGSQSDDPKLAVSWEAQYQSLLKGGQTEETRKRYSDMSPSPTNPSSLVSG